MDTLVQCRVSLIEQPFPVGREKDLDGYVSPIPIAADETVQSRIEMPANRARFNMINIKLDKCGGLTEALQMQRLANDYGLQTMVGNMMGTSLAMAPAFLVGQQCQVSDIDGAIFLKEDRDVIVRYEHGKVSCPNGVWGP